MERKKSLRILAGVFLLIGLVLSLSSTVFTYFFASRGVTTLSFFRLYWPTLLQDLILAAIVILIFCRVFIGAGIVEGVLVLWRLFGFVSTLLSLVRGPGRDMSSYYIGSALLNLIQVGVGVLFMIGFFMHNRSSKKLFIIGAILQLVSSLVSAILPSITVNAGYANASTILGMLGSMLFLDSFAFLGWLFLGLYFGAQTDGAAQPEPMYGSRIGDAVDP